ncbi:AAA family ATPase [Candidatus Nitrosacidococcus sp. I8]|uniref:AAA family ATPase n=1 Tax=Candidatus Nitrosacidococcus sp. I8 TaxID=2942908 RepID=UPI0022264681|nr:hypothetical protein [Candidatus Nitrosacidococcus sp. I8]
MVEERLQVWTSKQGSADRILSFGIKETNKLESFVEFGLNGYRFELELTDEGSFYFANEQLFFTGFYYNEMWISLDSGHKEVKLKEINLKRELKTDTENNIAHYCYSSISSWKVFHFHDTSNTAGVRRDCAVHDNEYLRPDAANLAAYLYWLSKEKPETLDQIRKIIRLALPFFDDFIFKPEKKETGEAFIWLLWK